MKKVIIIGGGAAGMQTALRLAERGIAVRCGLHCAPLAHETAGTLDSGTLRMSFSPFNSAAECAEAADAVIKILKNT